MTKLVIAEKPDLGRDIARAICGRNVSATEKLPIEGNGYIVCALAGHVLELKEPGDIDHKWQVPWTEEALPVMVPSWPLKVSDGKERILDTIEELIRSAECVIHAGDPDDEGQLLVDEVIDYFGYDGPVYRVLVNDSVEKNIRRAFDDMKPNEEFYPLGRAAYARAVADMAFGINESRLATMRLGAKVSIGRVQTPTLGLVVARDAQISSHEKQRFYELELVGKVDGSQQARFRFKPKKEQTQDGKHIFDQEELHRRAEAARGCVFDFETTETKKTEHPPLPYNLVELIGDASKKYGLAAPATQQATQTLRDVYKAITYNRSDSRYLKDEHFDDAEDVLCQALENIGCDWKLDYSIKGQAFDESKVTAHHAIIPQEVKLDIKQMTETERSVYELITKRYAIQFSEDALYEVSQSVIANDMDEYALKLTRLVSPGWKSFDGATETNSDFWITAGRHTFEVEDYEIIEKETTPPKPYTDATLIADMSSIAKYVKDPDIKETLKKKDEGKKGENGGIGTVATRTQIIETLKKRGFIEVDSKGKISSTEFGRSFFNMLPIDIKTPDITAKWWLMQQQVAEGAIDADAIQRSVAEEFERHRYTAYAGMSLRKPRECVGKCPKCGKDIITSRASYQCESNRFEKNESGDFELVSGCGFSMPASIAGKKITNKQAEALLNHGRTSLISGFKSKKGEKFKAILVLDDDTKKISFEFPKGGERGTPKTVKKRAGSLPNKSKRAFSYR